MQRKVISYSIRVSVPVATSAAAQIRSRAFHPAGHGLEARVQLRFGWRDGRDDVTDGPLVQPALVAPVPRLHAAVPKAPVFHRLRALGEDSSSEPDTEQQTERSGEYAEILRTRERRGKRLL
jgi:hypothetical protein